MPEPPYEPGERRPIATREKNWAKRVAMLLVRWRVTPNAISVAGMVAGLGAGVAFWATARFPEQARYGWVAGAVLVQLRLLANMLDGMVAVQTGQASPVGELYNEVPDRVSDVCTLIGFGYAAGSEVVLGYLAATLAVFTAYVRAMGKVAGGTQEFCGPMAKPQRMFFVTVAALFCALAPAGWQPAVPSWGAAAWTLLLVSVGCVVTGLRRLSRTAAVLRSKGQ